MKEKLINKIAYYSFYLAVIIEVLIVIIDKSAWVNPVEGWLFRITFALCLIKIILTKYDRAECIAILCAGMLALISYKFSGRNELLRIVAFVAACKNIDMKKCLKLVFWLTAGGCLLLGVLSIIGVGGALSMTEDFGRGSVETRYMMGLGHPNAFHCMFWAIITLGIYVYENKASWYGYVSALVGNFLLYTMTGSKTSFAVLTLTILVAAFLKFVKSEKIKRIGGICLVAAQIFAMVISVVLAFIAKYTYEYDWSIDRGTRNTIVKKIDLMLTGRMRTLVETDRWEGTPSTWTLFSCPENNYYFDLGWVRLFYWYGIIPACIICLVLITLSIYLLNRKQYMALLIVASFAVYTIVEAHAVSDYIGRNYVIFILGGAMAGMLAGIKPKEDI